MSRKIINAVLGLASVDPGFCQALLQNPLEAIHAREFELTEEEEQAFSRITALDLYEFSQKLLALIDLKD